MRSNLFAPQNQEREAQPGLQLQNSKMLKIALAGEVLARQGAMVAYQGDVRFEALGAGGIGRFIKQQLTGEGVPLMKLSGRGDVFLADAAADVHVIDLEGPHDALSINGRNVLAFEPTLSYDIRMVQGAGMVGTAGLFNCVFSGQGRIAITAKGAPVVLSVEEVRRVLEGLDGIDRLMAEILYGAGLRVLECCRLRVKDVDFDRHQLIVREGK